MTGHISCKLRSCLILVCMLPCILLSSCGDALSSLQGVQSAQLEQFTMTIVPDFTRRGETQTFVMTLEHDFITRLAGSDVYPSEIRFGQGTSLRSFTMEQADTMSAQVLISPLAEEGQRQPVLLFATDESVFQVTGTFWILPALSE